MQIKMNGVVKTRILMVCLGNICRSPLAEGIMQDLILKQGLSDEIEVDSAGTSGHCTGNFPDERSVKVARANGIILQHRARQLLRKDFTLFDHILVMDESNLKNSRQLARDEYERSKLAIITEFDPRPDRPLIVADPYWGDMSDFERVYLQLVHCCEGWLLTNYKRSSAG